MNDVQFPSILLHVKTIDELWLNLCRDGLCCHYVPQDYLYKHSFCRKLSHHIGCSKSGLMYFFFLCFFPDVKKR